MPIVSHRMLILSKHLSHSRTDLLFGGRTSDSSQPFAAQQVYCLTLLFAAFVFAWLFRLGILFCRCVYHPQSLSPCWLLPLRLPLYPPLLSFQYSHYRRKCWFSNHKGTEYNVYLLLNIILCMESILKKHSEYVTMWWWKRREKNEDDDRYYYFRLLIIID